MTEHMLEHCLQWNVHNIVKCHCDTHYSTDFVSKKTFSSIKECQKNAHSVIVKYNIDTSSKYEIKVLFRPPIISGVDIFVSHYLQNRFEIHNSEQLTLQYATGNDESCKTQHKDSPDGIDLQCGLPQCFGRLIKQSSYQYYWEIMTKSTNCQSSQHSRKLCSGEKQASQSPRECIISFCYFFEQNIKSTTLQNLPMTIYFCIKTVV